MTQILVNYWGLQEQARHNQVYESETNRHNLATEQLQAMQIAVEQQKVNVQQGQLQLGYAQLQETTRHNKAYEGIQASQVSLGMSQLQEALRHNQVMETRVQYQNYADYMSANNKMANTANTLLGANNSKVGKAVVAGGLAAGASTTFSGVANEKSLPPAPAVTGMLSLPKMSSALLAPVITPRWFPRYDVTGGNVKQ